MNFQLPNNAYETHPSGAFEGQILSVEDKGEVDTQFGRKHKIVIVIESKTALMDDGHPHTAWLWCTISGSPKSKLYEIRSNLLGRDLTDVERSSFKDEEIIGRRVGYQIVHRDSGDGKVFANVANVWPAVHAGPVGHDGSTATLTP